MATILEAADKALILDVREALIQPFNAGEWADLRLGLWLSITSENNDDDLAALTESLAYSTSADRPFIGIKTDNDTLPGNSGVNFAGLTGYSAGPWTVQDSSPNSDYWYINNGLTTDVRLQTELGASIDGTISIASWLRLPNSNSVSAGYAYALLLKFTRSGSVIFPRATLNWDSYVFTDTPDIDLLRSHLASDAYPTSAPSSDFGANIPTAVYAYWPFNNSRLRIHAIVLEKFA